jgi:hypothetical protein
MALPLPILEDIIERSIDKRGYPIGIPGVNRQFLSVWKKYSGFEWALRSSHYRIYNYLLRRGDVNLHMVASNNTSRRVALAALHGDAIPIVELVKSKLLCDEYWIFIAIAAVSGKNASCLKVVKERIADDVDRMYQIYQKIIGDNEQRIS